MTTILFVDNRIEEYERFLTLPFAKKHKDEILYVASPVNLHRIVEDHPELRLILLDILWESEILESALPLGADAMVELAEFAPDIPVVIYSVIDDEATLHRLIPEMMRLGAFDWVSKDEPKNVRSFRIETAYNRGRNKEKAPPSRAILPPDQSQRSGVHVAVMFTDMCGFTALCHQIQAAGAVSSMLREFYKLVCDATLKNGGYVDKYIGDAVMAVFGASGGGTPRVGPFDHVTQSINAARHVLARASAFRIEHVEPLLQRANLQLGAEPLRKIGNFRVAIESGDVDVVRFERGSESEVTFIGTPVNIAARIMNSGSGGEAWMGENARGSGAPHALVGEELSVQYKNLPGEFHMYKLLV